MGARTGTRRYTSLEAGWLAQSGGRPLAVARIQLRLLDLCRSCGGARLSIGSPVCTDPVAGHWRVCREGVGLSGLLSLLVHLQQWQSGYTVAALLSTLRTVLTVRRAHSLSEGVSASASALIVPGVCPSSCLSNASVRSQCCAHAYRQGASSPGSRAGAACVTSSACVV